jgi:hypothetical protein
MSRRRLEIAGALALTSGILTIPLAVVQVLAAEAEGGLPADVIALLQTALGIYLLVTFRELLHERFACREADGAIGFLITGSVVVFVLGLLRNVARVPDMERFVGLAFTVAAAALGVGSMIFAFRLLRLLRRPRFLTWFAHANLVMGICLASVVLVPVAILVSMIADLLMGLIFLEAARDGPGAWEDD